jgi:hypothetical protein
MRWQLGRRSQNVEDRRGMGTPAGMRFPGGLGRGGGIARGGGIGGIGLLVLLVVGWLLGVDPSFLLQETSTGVPYQQAPSGQAPPADDQRAAFVSVVLADTEDTWRALFDQAGRSYREPTLVLFSDAVESACGFAQAAMGPFYCPGDQKLYIDLTFFDELHDRFGAPGDFAQAYVIAHEVGHHIQNLTGTLDRAQQMQARAGRTEGNQVQVGVELQADCYAGVWAANAKAPDGGPLLEPGDVEEGMRAAEAIGDDTLQRSTQGRVVPESFTHGTSEQRMAALRRGLQTGDPAACDFAS